VTYSLDIDPLAEQQIAALPEAALPGEQRGDPHGSR
jgi:hypothetical protein